MSARIDAWTCIDEASWIGATCLPFRRDLPHVETITSCIPSKVKASRNELHGVTTQNLPLFRAPFRLPQGQRCDLDTAGF